ncbi:hypothetical protein COB64_02880 [Candidatus Wolfebacteria bacterium]|nr:MAG: hypothetical protein COB64_02880 [Candidatus Wolfebacteria bacterium]
MHARSLKSNVIFHYGMNIFRKKRKFTSNEIFPDEIFLDAQNIPNFDTQQLEGKFETPITKMTVSLLGIFFILIAVAFSWKLELTQVKRGEAFFSQSENNSLEKSLIFSERGIIYDRNGLELAWNSQNDETDAFTERSYTELPGLGHLLGFVSNPATDSEGNYWQTTFIGKDGTEKQYNEQLAGTNGSKILESNVFGEVQSENVIVQPKNGENITLTIDAELQSSLHDFIGKLARRNPFKGGTGVIMDVQTGEILALTSYPEYNPEILSRGSDSDAINGYIHNTQLPFLNRSTDGLYTPGSVVKPFIAIGALNEKLITPEKKILSTGSISIQNPYDPDLKSVFKDWKAHGYVDMRRALAVSSNVYFYEIGGGYEDQLGLGIKNIEKYLRLFGMGEKTDIDLNSDAKGLIPNPKWKKATFNGDPWRLGDTYNTAIGQYGFQVTPVQIVRATAALANSGTLHTPHLVANDTTHKETTIPIDPELFNVVHEGMRQAVTLGTAKILEMPYVQVAAKTGTAQVGVSKKFVNSWVTGYFPYKNPQYAFTVLMEQGSANNSTGAVFVMKDMLNWMNENTPDYLN